MQGVKCSLVGPMGIEGDKVWLTQFAVPLELVVVPDGQSCLVLDATTQECIGGGFFYDNKVEFSSPVLVTSLQPVELLWTVEFDEADVEEDDEAE